jgi:hypothetical protein
LKDLEWKTVVYIWCGHLVFFIPVDVFYGNLVNFVAIWYIFFYFGILYREKSGNPATKLSCERQIERKNCFFRGLKKFHFARMKMGL